ncbi:hypothetical protein J4H92_06320 [Leucobacter weissii]|uniref:Uncharacterized protein n=1 Tax=Leucobacter weissii TaxID=1983706 RepID=A0A939MRA5_9MICO|nr:hypothetical protein [Leucobacter weissii]MBO1901564.1 hypothetical protein [Leucobacter weissii]
MRTVTTSSGLRTGVVVVAVVAALLLPGAVASAVPADGPGSDTSGTSSRVWPAEVRVGDRLNFEVAGYPANETLYIKIDDGAACSDTSHGACVYATQKLDANGSASGSIVVPKLGTGAHWLRMLATGDVFDKKTGEKLGYEGYTRRGGNDFTVVAGGSGSSTDSGPSSDSAPSGGGTEVDGEPGEEDVEGGTVAIDATEIGDIEIDEETRRELEELTANVAEGEEATAADEVDASAAEAVPGSGIPVVGIVAVGIAALLGGALLTWAIVRRRRLLASSGPETSGARSDEAASNSEAPEG